MSEFHEEDYKEEDIINEEIERLERIINSFEIYKTIKNNNECVICYEINENVFDESLYNCNHNNICIGCCHQLLIKIINKCPICRCKLTKKAMYLLLESY